MSWLVALLLVVIAFNEIQRTWAMERGHRERQNLSIRVEEMNCKLDWVVGTRRPISSARPPTLPILAPDGSGCRR